MRVPLPIVPEMFKTTTFTYKIDTVTKKYFSDFLAWEQDIFMYGSSWNLDATPRLKGQPHLLKKIAHLDPLKLASQNAHIKAAMLACVEQYGLLLSIAHPELQNDKELVLASIRERASSVQYASSSLKHDPEVIETVLKQDGLCLSLLPLSVRSDPKWVKMAVSENGLSLKYAQLDLKAHDDIVLTACQQNGFALQFAALSQKENKQIVQTAVSYSTTKEELLNSVSEHAPGSQISEVLIRLRYLHQRLDPLFLERLRFIDLFQNVKAMPIHFAHLSLQQDRTIADIAETRFMELTGRAGGFQKVKKARLMNPRASDGLVAVGKRSAMPLETIAEESSTEQDFIGPSHGITSLRDLLSARLPTRQAPEPHGGAGAEPVNHTASFVKPEDEL